MAYSSEPRQLKDYEVLGVGASRRARLLQDREPSLLQIHPDLVAPSARGLYEAVLEDTLAWLKPSSLQEVKISQPVEDFLYPLLEKELKKELPLVAQVLKSELKPVLVSYLREFPWQGPLLTEHFRYFPIFVKKKFSDSRLYLLAQGEWLSAYLSFADFGLPAQEEARVLLNPSLQTLYVPFELAELSLTSGLYVYYYDSVHHRVRRYKLDIYEAALVDLLGEDRKFTRDPLLDQALCMELGGSLSREAWLKKLSYLSELGIILESDSRRIADQKL